MNDQAPLPRGTIDVPDEMASERLARQVRLEDLTVGSAIAGIDPRGPVRVVQAQWHGADCLELTYKDPTGRTDSRLLYRDDEPRLDIVAPGPRWSFDGDGDLFKLAAEAQRIRLAYLFDPMLSVHTSLVEPLPHQIIAVYDELLPVQPLRFLLADDPGAGKTIMTGLFIKELMLRGDLERCMVVCPGVLAEQWQDELSVADSPPLVPVPPSARGEDLRILEQVDRTVTETCRSVKSEDHCVETD